MRSKVTIVVILAGIALAASFAIRQSTPKQLAEPETQPVGGIKTPETASRAEQRHFAELPSASRTAGQSAAEPLVPSTPVPTASAVTNRVERLAQIREAFRALAAGDTASALHAAKQITNAVERE